MPIQSLPSEIVTAIIEHIPSKNDQSSISLVSKYFLALARPILFSTIIFPRSLWFSIWHERRATPSLVLGTPNQLDCSYPRDYEVFVSFLASAPQLAFFIRNLSLWGNPLQNQDDPQPKPLEPKVLNDILSMLPSLHTLCLHNVWFARSNTPVIYRYNSIDRLILSCALYPWDVIIPLAFFSHIRELELGLRSSWIVPGDPSSLSPEQLLQWWDVSDIIPTHLEVSNIHLRCSVWPPSVCIEMLKGTRASKTLRSFSIHSSELTAGCHPSSILFDFLKEAAPTLTHMTLGAGSPTQGMSDDQCAYHKFDSPEMRARLAPLTSVHSLTLRMFSTSPHEAFGRMIPILASFPPCLRRITFSLAQSEPWVGSRSTGKSWVSPLLDLRQLVPLLQRYSRLEAVVFEGEVGTRNEEKERILKDLPEFQEMILFVEGRRVPLVRAL